MANDDTEHPARRVGPPSRKVNLRKTNPTLYWLMTVVAGGFLLVGASFVFGPPPTFEQFDVPKNAVGAGFLALAIVDLFVLNVRRDLKMMKLLTVAGLAYTAAWGVGTSETGFLGLSSFQLPSVYLALVGVQVVILATPFVNPVIEGATEEARNGQRND